MHAFSLVKEVLTDSGNLHGIVNKAMAAASPFLAPHTRTRRPYLPISDEVVELFRRRVEEECPDLLWRG